MSSRRNFEISFLEEKKADVIKYLWDKSNVRRFCYYQMKKKQENEEQKSFIYVNLMTKSRISTFETIKDSIVNVEPAEKVIYNLKKRYGDEKGFEYFDKEEEQTNVKTLKRFLVNEILIKGTEPTSLIRDRFKDEDATSLLELLVNRARYEKLKTWHDICKANMEPGNENRMRSIFKKLYYFYFLEQLNNLEDELEGFKHNKKKLLNEDDEEETGEIISKKIKQK